MMVINKFPKSILVALFLIGALAGCAGFDNLPQLEIQVLDESGKQVPGAYVGLFTSETEWNKRENPRQAWRVTDSAGKVIFADLEEIPYYIYVRFEAKDNSSDEVIVTEPLRVNHRTQVVIHIR
jgi:hypothetical protein